MVAAPLSILAARVFYPSMSAIYPSLCVPAHTHPKHTSAGLVKPASQKILVPTPHGQGTCQGPWQGMHQPTYCKRHAWCSLPCIECAGQDLYEASYGSRPSTGSMLPGAGASFTYVDMGMTTFEGTGATYMPGFTEPPEGKHIRRLKSQMSTSSREKQTPSTNPLFLADSKTKLPLSNVVAPAPPKRARAVLKQSLKPEKREGEQLLWLHRINTDVTGSPRRNLMESAGSSRPR